MRFLPGSAPAVPHCVRLGCRSFALPGCISKGFYYGVVYALGAQSGCGLDVLTLNQESTTMSIYLGISLAGAKRGIFRSLTEPTEKAWPPGLGMRYRPIPHPARR
jgi:hypothetical protein